MKRDMPTQLDDPQWLCEQYATFTQQEIADSLGVARSTVYNRMKSLGITARRPGARCGIPQSPEQRVKESQARRDYWKNLSPERYAAHILNVSKGKTTKGGITFAGRRIYILGRGRVYEHRYVMEQALGRPLESTEHVHHIDGDMLNNALDNLKIVSNFEHQFFHAGKLSKDDVLAIRDAWENQTASQAALARHYGVSSGTVNKIIHRKRWKHI